MASDVTPEPEKTPKRARIPVAERRARLEQLVLRRTKLDDRESDILRELFPLIFTAHHGLVWKQLGKRRLADGVREELLLDTFTGLFTWSVNHGFPDDIPKMLRVLAMRHVLNHLRARRRAPLSVALPSSGSEKPPVSVPDLELAMDSRALGPEIFAALSQEHQDVIEVVVLGELSHDEAALALEIPEGTLKSRLRAAKEEFLTTAKKCLQRKRRGPE